MARTPRHLGKALQPQNEAPARAPCLAVRRAIALPHFGQVGDSPDAATGAAAGCAMAAGVATGRTPLAFSIIPVSAPPEALSATLRASDSRLRRPRMPRRRRKS